jgi:hypothetical protein
LRGLNYTLIHNLAPLSAKKNCLSGVVGPAIELG